MNWERFFGKWQRFLEGGAFGLSFLLWVKILTLTRPWQGDVALPDFDAYYRLVRGIFSGVNPYAVSYTQTLGPPVVFLYFLPLGLLPLTIARSVTTIVNVASGYLVCWLLARAYSPKQVRLAFLLGSLGLFSAFVTRHSLLMGQPMLVVVLLVTIALTSSSQKLLGLVAGLAMVIKPFLAILCFPLAGKRPSLVMSLVVFGVGLFATFGFIRPHWQQTFLTGTLPALGVNETTLTTDYYSQTLRATLGRVSLSGLYYPVLVLVAVMGGYLAYRRRSLTLGILLSLFVSPVVWQYYFVLLFPVFVVVLARLWQRGSMGKWVLWGLGVCLWWIELGFLHATPLTLVSGILASHYLVSSSLLLAVDVWG